MSPLEARFLEAARSMVGAPYANGGRCRRAVDCAGLLILCAGEAGMQVGGIRYMPDASIATARGWLELYCEASDPAPGRIGLFSRRAGMHLAVFDSLQGELAVIHASKRLGRVVRIPAGARMGRLEAAYALRG